MSNDEKTKYFDLHTTGIGYLSRVREVTPKGGLALYRRHHCSPAR